MQKLNTGYQTAVKAEQQKDKCNLLSSEACLLIYAHLIYNVRHLHGFNKINYFLEEYLLLDLCINL